MYKIIDLLRCSKKFKNALFYLICFLLFAYIFSVPSFGSREKLNYIVFALMFLLATSVLLYMFLYKAFLFNKWTLLVPSFVLFSLIGTIIYSHEYRLWLTLVLLCISFYVIYYVLLIFQNKNLAISILIAGLFCFAIYFFAVYYKELMDFSRYAGGSLRLGDYFDGVNQVSAFAAIGLMASLYSILFFKTNLRFLFLIPIIAFFVVGSSTGSRTFIFVAIFMVLISTFFKFKKHLFLYFLVVIILTVVFIVLINLPFMETMRVRLTKLFETFFSPETGYDDRSAIERFTWLNYGFYIGNKHILTGVGVYGFGSYSGVGTYTHSNFSELWCDFGLPGFVLFHLPWLICLIFAIKNKSNGKPLVFMIITYYIVISFSNVFYYTKFYFLNLGIMYNLAFDCKNDKSSIHINDLKTYCKKIVITCDGMSCDGAERVISLLSNSFSSFGYDVTIIGVSTHVEQSFYPLEKNVNYITLHKGRKEKICFVKRVRLLRKTLKSIKPDVIISFLPHVNVYTQYATIGFKCPIIVSERNNPKKDPKGFVLRKLKYLSFIKADGVVFQTEEARNFYLKSIREKSIIINNPIHVKRFTDDVEKKKVVLSVGRLVEQKNFTCLIDAFSKFSKKNPEYLLRIYGEGPLRNELIQYAKDNGVLEKFELLGNDFNWLEKEINDAMFILSSNYEGVPNALLEALIAGIPCISTDCPSGGPKSLIHNDIDGYLIPVNDSESMEKRMNDILLKPFKWHLNNDVQKYSSNAVAAQWLDYIRLVLERKKTS